MGYFDGTMQVYRMDVSILRYRERPGYELFYRMYEIGWCELHPEIPGVSQKSYLSVAP